MASTTFSSRRFNQDASGAKRAAAEGPVFITDRGKPAFVLMSIGDYRRLSDGKRSIADMLALDGVDDLDAVLDEVRVQSRQAPRPADFD